MSGNPFRVLGISPRCTHSDLKRRYRELSRRYHPDVPETGSESKFKEVFEAYREAEEMLKTPNKVATWGYLGYHHKSLFKIRR